MAALVPGLLHARGRQGKDYAEGHVLILFKPASEVSRESDPDLLLHRIGRPPSVTLRENGFSAWTRRYERGRPQRLSSGKQPVDATRFLKLEVRAGESVESICRELNGHSALAYAEPDYIGYGGFLPNDPDLSSQWQHTNSTTPSAFIRTPAAWDITMGSTGITLAVLDTGLNMTLPEFSNRVVAGYDFVNDDADPTDDHNHGTAVASCSAANGDNGYQLAGVDWFCKLMPIKVLDSGNSGFYSDWAAGIDWAVSNGARVVNLSAGGASDSFTLSNAIMRAIASGAIFVTITHNDSSSAVRFPGRMTSCITIGSSAQSDARSGFSNYGEAMDVIAPGSSMRVILKDGSLSTWQGTSFAAPLVAGVATLVLSLNTNITHYEMEQLLRAASDDLVGSASEDKEGFDHYHGSGRLNALRVLQDVTNIAPREIWTLPLAMDGALSSLETFALRTNNGAASSLRAWFDNGWLYVATEDARAGIDKFIFISTNPSGMVSAPWAKSGQVGDHQAYLADEHDNQFRSWWTNGGQAGYPCMTAERGTNHLEGAIPVAEVFGAIPDRLYIAVGAYPTADGSGLSSALQCPSGNGNGDIESNEYYVLELGGFDTDRDGVPDLLEDANRNGQVDAGEPSPRKPDSDGDFLSDSNEVFLLGSDPADEDTDDDRQTDGEEWLAGTVLTNSAAYFCAITGLTAGVNTEGVIAWQSVTGRRYSVWSWDGELDDTGTWIQTWCENVSGNGSVLRFTNGFGDVTSRTYRVTVGRE